MRHYARRIVMPQSDRLLASTPERYTVFAQVLHWAIVILLCLQFAIAWIMPDIGRGTVPDRLINLHLSFGLLIIFVMAVRLLWRITHAVPAPPVGLPAWQATSASLAHAALYILLFVVPVLGWINASYRGWTVEFFGLFPLPALVAARGPANTGAILGPWSGDVHIWLSYALLTAIGLHVLGALYHRIVLRDDVLGRMVPGA
jgi:cytochrome b561